MKSMQLPLLKRKGRHIKKKSLSSIYFRNGIKDFFFIPLAATLSDNDDQASASQNKSAFGPLQALKKTKNRITYSAKHMKALTDTTCSQMDRGVQLEAPHALRYIGNCAHLNSAHEMRTTEY